MLSFPRLNGEPPRDYMGWDLVKFEGTTVLKRRCSSRLGDEGVFIIEEVRLEG